MIGSGDTIVALSSGRPPAAVAVIRTSGPAAFAAARALAGDLPDARRAVVRTVRDPTTGEPIDQVVLLRFDGPHSATGENIIEYQCHGGRAVVERLIALIESLPGVRAAQPGEFTRRALSNGRIDLTEAEGLADLLSAETEAQRRAAQAMAGGALRRQIEAWRDRLVDLSARAEAAIDYVGDEDETAIDLPALVAQARDLSREMTDVLARPRADLIRDGVQVVFAGPPNAGKSSLLNALCDSERAIVTDIPGTTRDLIRVPIAIGGLPFVLIDTAGLRDGGDVVEAIGISLAEGAIDDCDILVWLGESNQRPDHPRAIQLAPKADLKGSLSGDGLPVSAHTGAGLDKLVEKLVDEARAIVGAESSLLFNRRQAAEVESVVAAVAMIDGLDIALIAEALRSAVAALDRVTGRQSVDDMLDRLFQRFCLGK